MLKAARDFRRVSRVWWWTRRLKSVANCQGRLRVNGPWRVLDPHKLTIADNVHFAGEFYINAKGCVTIGANTHISRNLVCYSYNHNYEGDALPYDDTSILKPVAIGQNVWIGMNVCIAPGVSIGEGAIIGLGAVVVSDVPPLAVVGGNPAKVLKHRNSEHYFNLVEQGKFGGASGKPLAETLGDMPVDEGA